MILYPSIAIIVRKCDNKIRMTQFENILNTNVSNVTMSLKHIYGNNCGKQDDAIKIGAFIANIMANVTITLIAMYL